MRFRMQTADYTSNVLAIRERNAIATIDIKQVQQDIESRLASRVGDLPEDQRTPFLVVNGGWSKMILAEIGPEPQHTRNELGFINETAWYIWSYLKNQVHHMRPRIVQRICEQNLVAHNG